MSLALLGSNKLVTAQTTPDGSVILVTSDGTVIPTGGSSALKKDSDGWNVVRASVGFVQDYDGVLLELSANEPGFYGARRVKNLFLNPQNFSSAGGTVNFVPNGSDLAVSTMVYPDTDNTEGLTATNAITGNGYLVASPFGNSQYALPQGIYATRLTYKVTSGQITGWTHQQRTGGAAIGSESNSFNFTASGDWENYSATIQHFEKHNGFTLHPFCSGNATASLCYPQVEDVTGHKAGKEINSEFVPTGTGTGTEWYDVAFAATRTNPSTIYGQDNGVVTYGGALTIAAAPASLTTIKGLLVEPAATNKVTAWNTAGHVGVAVLDGVSTLAAYTNRTPALTGNTDVLLDSRSSRLVYNATDIALVDGGAGTDSITSTVTNFVAAGFRAGQSVWVWRANTPTANGEVQGPFDITSVTANTIVLPTGAVTARSSGNATHIMRVPDVDDKILIGLNNGTYHSTTVNAVTIPPYNATFASHDSVVVAVATAPATNGGYGGSNNNRAVYYYNSADLGITITGGTGATLELVHDFAALRDSGLGFACRSGLVYKMYGGTSGTALFKFDGAVGATGVNTLSVYGRRISGSGSTPYIQLDAHAGTDSMATASVYERAEIEVNSANTVARLLVGVGSGVTAYIVLPQMEAGSLLTTPIVTSGAAATRSGTVVSKPWGIDKQNGISASFKYTPTSIATTEEQVLWSVYQDSDNHLSIELTGSTMRARKRAHGINYDSTLAVTAVVGTTMAIAASFTTAGVSLTVNSVAGSSQTDGRSLVLHREAVHQIGGRAAVASACGTFMDLTVI